MSILKVNNLKAKVEDKEILKDKSHYRVANFGVSAMQDGSTSYFHKSVGGYHAAKLGRYQDVIDFHFNKNNMEVYNMLNTKYFIIPTQEGGLQTQVNPDANGNAWFVNSLKIVDNANQEIVSLDSLKTKFEAVVRKDVFDNFGLQSSYKTDSLASINLTEYKLNYLKYNSKSTSKQFAVFSEVFYEEGWKAYINGVEVPHVNVNYILRGLEIPKGDNTVEFKFEPKVIEQGNKISLVSYLLFLVIPVGWFFLNKKKS